MSKYETIIGMEVHIELQTSSKMFCDCPADHFAKKTNTQTCPVCLGLPGALPVPNAQAIRWAQTLGAALGCQLAKNSKFDRKHYFYPDLPKGYQISQYDAPLAENGGWTMEHGISVRISRVHLEEDTGKLIHQKVDGKEVTLIDFNRSGVPLVEIVTEPDFRDIETVSQYARSLQQIARYLGISDADMEKGSMRLEANVSLRKKGERGLPNYRIELKNINSFRFLLAAINYEIARQEGALDKGEPLRQETRGYDEKLGVTRVQRWKEEAKDYRYFPEPDIPIFSFTEKEIQQLRSEIPELPKEKRARFAKEYGLSKSYADFLTEAIPLADYFEEAVRVGKDHGVSGKEIADVIVNKKPNIEDILPSQLIEMLKGGKEKAVLSNEELIAAIVQSIKENPKAAEDYKQGREVALQFLLGRVMAETKGKADPQKIQKLLAKKLR